MRKLIALLFTLQLSLWAQAQRIDPKVHHWMQQALNTGGSNALRQDSLLTLAFGRAKGLHQPLLEIKILHLQGLFNAHRGDWKKATQLLQKAVFIADSLKTSTEEGRDAKAFLAMVYTTRDVRDSGAYWVKRTMLEATQMRDTFNISALLTLSAVIQRDSKNFNLLAGQYDSAIFFAAKTQSPHDDFYAIVNKSYFLKMEGNKDWVKSLELLLSLERYFNSPDIGTYPPTPTDRFNLRYREAKNNIYQQIAHDYFTLHDFDNAINYQKMVTKNYLARKQYLFFATHAAALGAMEAFKGNEVRVQHLYDSCTQFFEKNTGLNNLYNANYYFIKGWLLEKKGLTKNAISAFEAGLSKHPDYWLQLALFRNFSLLKNYQKTDSLELELRKSMKSSFVYNSPTFFYKEMAAHHYRKGLLSVAQHYEIKFYKTKDSLLQATRYLEILELQTKFQSREKDRQLAQAQRDRETQEVLLNQKQLQVLLLALLMVLFTMLFFVLVKGYYTKKRQAAQLEKKNQEIEALAQELHHRVKNNLQVVSSLLSLQSNQVKDNKLKEIFEDGKGRIEAMSIIHQQLSAKADINKTNLTDYLTTLSVSVAESFGYPSDVIAFTKNESGLITIEKALPIGLMLNEILTNSFKHGFTGIEAPKIDLSLSMEAAAIHIKVSDNGVGFSGVKKKSTSLGTYLINLMVKQLEASLTVDGSAGTTYQILIPLK